MSTRTETNRINAQKSTGPRTPEGKARSSRNAMKHNLTGQVTLMCDEERISHDTFCEALVQHYGPEGALELQIAQSIAEDEWRLNRVRAIEQNILALGTEGPEGDIEADHPEIQAAVALAAVFMKDANGFARLSLYESRIHRNIQKSEDRLRKIQEERIKATELAVSRTEVLLKHAAATGTAYDPAPDFPPERGFVFSTEKVVKLIDRKNRFQTARNHEWNVRRKPETGPDDLPDAA